MSAQSVELRTLPPARRAATTLGAGSSFAGNILALTSITIATGASLSGRALASNGGVKLDSNTISKLPGTQAVAPTLIPTPAHVSVNYQCAADGRVVVSVDLTAGVSVSGLGEAITSATGTSGNPIVRYLAPVVTSGEPRHPQAL